MATINEQVIALAKYRCKKLLKFKRNRPILSKELDIEFIKDLDKKLEKGIDLTSSQVEGIKNVYNAFIKE